MGDSKKEKKKGRKKERKIVDYIKFFFKERFF